MIKLPGKLKLEDNFLNFVKKIYEKPRANIVLNGEKPEGFLPRSGIRQGCSLSHCT